VQGERIARESKQEGVGERAREKRRGRVNLDCMQRLLFTKVERERKRMGHRARERERATAQSEREREHSARKRERRAREKREGARSKTEIEPEIENAHTHTQKLAWMLTLTKWLSLLLLRDSSPPFIRSVPVYRPAFLT